MFSTLEGETPLEDLSGLIPDFITTREELSQAEMKNIIEVEKTLYKLTFKYSISFFYKIHKDMFKYVWRWAGKKRVSNLNIGVDFLQIEIEIKKLIDDLKFWESNNQNLVETVTFFHHRLVKIHPFLNGNGRWARFLTKVYANSVHNVKIQWPEAEYTKNSDFRALYISALSKADHLDYADLLNIHKECVINNT